MQLMIYHYVYDIYIDLYQGGPFKGAVHSWVPTSYTEIKRCRAYPRKLPFDLRTTHTQQKPPNTRTKNPTTHTPKVR